MKFSITSSLFYQAFESSTVICSVACQDNNGQQILSEKIETNPNLSHQEIVVGLEANRLLKFDVAKGNFSINYSAKIKNSASFLDISSIGDSREKAFGATTFPYLHASRYVPTDRMRSISRDLFGKINGQLNQVFAIENWLNDNVYYRIGTSTEQSWGLDTFESRTGVCRDFAHLGIGFCRALNIPARYVTVYAYHLSPQDFHAVFEAFIDGNWILFDGTRLAPLNGMNRIATGRDASETAVGNLYGNIQGQSVNVWTQIAMDETEIFEPLTRQDLNQQNKVLMLG